MAPWVTGVGNKRVSQRRVLRAGSGHSYGSVEQEGRELGADDYPLAAELVHREAEVFFQFRSVCPILLRSAAALAAVRRTVETQ
jgi:hypothetical protein